MGKQTVFYAAVSAMLLAALPAEAANKYVRKGATGLNNGSDWANAYTELSQVSYTGLSGFTLYIAAGSYTSGFPTLSAVNNVTFKRATVADHGTATGWSASFDGQVTSTSSGKFLFVSNSDNFTFDGAGNNPWSFRVVGQNAYDGKFQVEGSTNALIRNIELDGNGCEPAIENGPEDGFRLAFNSNFVLEHSYVHNFYYCSYPNVGNPGHSDGIQMPSAEGAIIRYNRFQNNGMLLFFGDCDWSSQWANDVHVHHNVFIQQAGVGDNYRMIDMKGAGHTSADFVTIENNTFYRESGFTGFTLYENTNCPANTSQRTIRNNIFQNGSFDLAGGWGTASNNDFYTGSVGPGSNNLTSNPLFLSVQALDFHLQATSPVIGAGLVTTNTEDYDGIPIPTGTRPAMGAYQYRAAGVPSAPTNLRITAAAFAFFALTRRRRRSSLGAAR